MIIVGQKWKWTNDLFKMKKLFTIDIHTHILPKNIPDFNKKFGYGEFIQLEHHKPCCAKMMINSRY